MYMRRMGPIAILLALVFLASALGECTAPKDALAETFREACTGYAGSAGTALKHAVAAVALMDTLADMGAERLTNRELRECTEAAVADLPEEAQEELRENLEMGIVPLLDAVFAGEGDLPGEFEDAGLADAVIEMRADPRYAACWSAFREALKN